MSQNIFLLDCSEQEIYKDFLEDSFFNVKAAIVFTEEAKNFCLSKGVEEVFTLKEIDFLSNPDYFDFNTMHCYQSTQRKVEFGMMRNLNSNMLIANKYYNALFTFEKIFKTHNIHCIFTNCIPHGYIPETIMLDMGKKYNIPTYCTFPITAHYSSILRYNDKKHIKITSPIHKNLVTQDVFNKNKNSYCIERINQKLPKISHRLIHKWGGGQIMIDILSALKRCSLKISMGFYQVRIFEKIYSFYRLKEMQKFYKRNSIVPNYKQKYLFYAIHFEPEAATGVIVDLQNQLTIIQILSQCIPEDWILYIKDHPHQYNINNTLDHYYLNNIQFFKDISFYQEVIKLKNVQLIKLDTPSEHLIQNAQAIATINGSIILESITQKKPCITFDNHLMPITQSNLFPNIHVFKDIQILKDFLNSKNPLLDTLNNESLMKSYEKLSHYYFDHHHPKSVIKESIKRNIMHKEN